MSEAGGAVEAKGLEDDRVGAVAMTRGGGRARSRREITDCRGTEFDRA